MIPIARNTNVTDVLPPPPTSSCEEGTIGWAEDGATWFEKGTASDDGKLLVHVTLFAGKPAYVTPQAGVAQGHQILCRMNTLAGHRIPPKGAVCQVIAPGGDWSPGNPVVVSLTEPNPLAQLDPKRVVLTFGDDVHVVVKGASAAIQDIDPNGGPSVFMSVGIPFAGGARGAYILTEEGSGFSATAKIAGLFAATAGSATALIQLTDNEVDVLCNVGSVAGFKIAGGDVKAVGAGFYTHTAGTYLGPGAVLANVALYGVPASPTPSATVFISP